MPLGTAYIDGLISGLDTTSIIEQIASIQRRPITRLTVQKSELASKLTLYRSIGASLTALGVAAADLSDPSDFIPHTLSVSDDTRLAASASSSAQQGSYEIVIQNLAEAHKVSSAAQTASDEALGYAGDIIVNGTAVAIEADDTLAHIRDAINNAGAGVTATILQVEDNDYRLMLSANGTGADNAIDLVDANASSILNDLGVLDGTTTIKHAVTNGARSDGAHNSALDVAEAFGLVIPPAGTVRISGQDVTIDLSVDSLDTIRDRINSDVTGVTASVVSEEVDGETVFRLQIVGDSGTPTFEDDNNVLQTLGILREGFADVKQQALDATVTVDGVTITRSTNSLDDVIAGVSMELLEADLDETITLTIERDYDAVVTQVRNFIGSYNRVASMINEAQSYDTETNTGGLLFGDAAILNLEDGLHRVMANLITVPGGDPVLLSSVGITTDSDGKLVVDSSDLLEALENDPNAVARMFGMNTVASTSDIEFVSATETTRDSGANGYVVNITQAAEQATATSATLASGITVDEILKFDDTYPVTLTAGMSLTEARDHLNSWFQTFNMAYEASVDGNQLVINHEVYGSDYEVAVSSSLDQGAGGTDLGGATAGQTATYAGLDVEGTINGEDCSGRGQFLSGLDDNETTVGLTLRITAATTGDIGTITIAKGAAQRLADYTTLLTSSDYGMITNGVDSLEDSMEGIDDEIELVSERVGRYVDRLRSQFLLMERNLAQASALDLYMTGQINALPRNYMRSSW